MKKPRGKPLTAEQKAENRRISRIRVRIEHVIGGVKRYRIIKQSVSFTGDVGHDLPEWRVVTTKLFSKMISTRISKNLYFARCNDMLSRMIAT